MLKMALAGQTASPQRNGAGGAPMDAAGRRQGAITGGITRKFGSVPDDPGPLATDLSAKLKPKAVASAMRKVADWQLAQSQQYFAAFDRSKQLDGTIWTWGALYSGLMAASESLGDPKYANVMRETGKAYNWELSKTESGANQHSMAQTYLELYLMDKKPEELAPTQATFDGILARPRVELGTGRRIEWWWCDALFMAPPVLSKLSTITGDRKYLDFMDHQWWITSRLLYSPTDHLFFRDASFLQKQEANGKGLFWSRGNGWVMAGLVRVLEEMPRDYPTRPKYLDQFREMAQEIASLQDKDGLWRPGLLDADAYRLPENSGSAFYVYALAYGVNAGILDRKKYRPVIEKAWAGLLSHIYQDGRLGCIQPIGAAPGDYKSTSSYVFGSGAFLLAGSEVYRLAH
jgi:rhamnogalacturonyl hydrolase YesR